MTAETSAFGLMAEEYDAWYDSDKGRPVYESELECLKRLVTGSGLPLLEIGVGTGRFAMHFPGAYGVDPAFGVLKLAQKRGIRCVNGVGESLSFRDNTFKTVLLIATLCFVDDPRKLLLEAGRVLASDGSAVIGFIPVDSPWGMLYGKKRREGSLFYRDAKFYTLADIEGFAKETGFYVTSVMSTLLQDPAGPARVEEPYDSYVEGAGFIFLMLEKKKDS